jgi:hypothetical protein
MYADFKITLWERIKIPKELEKNFEKKISEGKITCPHEAIRLLETVAEIERERLDDTVQLTLPKNNDGEATLQIFDNNHNILFSNDNI